MSGAEPGGAANTEHKPNYYLIWLILAVLTAVEVAVAYLSHLPRTVLIVVLVGLAIWKAVLVAMYYMHLRFERWRLIVMASAPIPLAFILVLAVLMEYAW